MASAIKSITKTYMDKGEGFSKVGSPLDLVGIQRGRRRIMGAPLQRDSTEMAVRKWQVTMLQPPPKL